MGTCWPKPVDSRPTTNSCSSPVHNDAKLIKNRNRHNSNSNNHENSRLSAADPNRGGEGGRGGSDHQGVSLSESMTERNSDGARGKDNNGQKINVASTFTFEELAMATQNFRESNLIGKGGFGSVYKGCLDSDVVVAVKQLNLEGLQGNQEFIVEVFMSSLLHHPNLVNLIGYCAHEEQRFLVYEYMPLGSLDRLLFDLEPDQKPLSWSTRLKIALDVAHGLEYLHCKTNPPVIYPDMKSSNILLDNDFNARLSDFGVSKLGPIGENTHVSTRVVGTYGYCAPEYVVSGKLTLNSDIYSFGVVLLELITGRKVIDHTRKSGEKNLIMWFLPFLKDHKKFVQMADPLLEMRFSIRSLHHAVAITTMCLQEQPSFRPAISDFVTALESVASQMGISDHHQGRIRVGHKNLEA